MKNILLLTALCTCIISGNAAAITKCVALKRSTTCSSSGYSGPDWWATCNTNGKSVQVRGIAHMANGSQCNYADAGETAALYIDDTIDASQVGCCWCRMTSPAVSSLWFSPAIDNRSKYADPTSLGACAQYCATTIKSDQTFRSRIFSQLEP